ncbi:MAG: major capsid protein [Methylococcaceae bacterium]|nr:MAG: major capsid protein [Methylococcaceae bacterium]
MDLFSTHTLLGIVQSLIISPQFFLTRYFPRVSMDESEEIHFDVIDKKRRLAPFVSPVVAGRIVQSQGYTTQTFKPAYVKDKRVFRPRRAVKRMAGEGIGGTLSAAQRMIALVAMDLQDQIDMIDRRLETMAVEAFRTGGVTVTGEGYPTQNVNFGRAAGNTVVLTGVNRWNQSGVDPLDHLQEWSLMIAKASGATPTDVIMDIDTWKVFRKNPAVIAWIDRFKTTATLTPEAAIKQGATYMGQVDAYNIFVYIDWYVDDNGIEQPMLPSGTVIMAGSQIEGVRAFGAIEDEDAGLQALEYFPKSWTEKDPAVRYLLMQSAPLVVPTRVNASFCATVL